MVHLLWNVSTVKVTLVGVSKKEKKEKELLFGRFVESMTAKPLLIKCTHKHKVLKLVF